MQEVLDTARLVDAGAVAGRGIAATVPRSEIEDVLRSEDGVRESSGVVSLPADGVAVLEVLA